MIIAGIDYSLTSPAIVIKFEDGTYKAFYFDIRKIAPHNPECKIELNRFDYPIWMHNEDRHEQLAIWSTMHLVMNDVQKVVLEGYSMGSKGKVFHMAENVGMLKYHLRMLSIPFEEVPPKSLKKQATGNGNAGKDLMEETFFNETGINLRPILGLSPKSNAPITDIIDAYFLTNYEEVE